MLYRNIFTLLFLGCLVQAGAARAQDSIKISGTIENPTAESIKITFNDNNLAYYPKAYTARVDKKGKFAMVFPFPKGLYIQAEVSYADKLAEVLLKAGDSLVLHVNTKQFDSTIRYSGRSSDVQNFVALHTYKIGRMNQYSVALRAAMNDEADTFLAKIQREYNNESAFLKAHGATLPKPFTAYWKGFYKYYNYFFMQQYPQMHEIIKLRRYTDTIPQANYSVISQMPVEFSDSCLQLPPYLLYLTGVLETRLKAAGYTWKGVDTAKARALEDSVNKLAYATMPPGSAEYYIAQGIYGRAKTQLLARTQAQFTAFKNKWPASSYLPLLNKQVSLAERLAPGQPAPDFDITTPDGRHMKLSDLKGKVVYLGFWAGWCRQCVGEMMGEKKIKDLIRKKPLEFVYVSISEDTATDRTIADRYKIEGTFTTATKGWASKEVELYGVQNLPAYYLIDEEGKFVLQNTPPPTQTMNLVMAIEKLFK